MGLRRLFKRGRIQNNDHLELLPHEILLDSKNIPQFDRFHCEGKIEKTISRSALIALGLFFLCIGFVFVGKVWALQIKDGELYSEKSENNRLRHRIVFADRGLIYDRNDTLLAWNERNSKDEELALRSYIDAPGFASVLGYVGYPKKDSKGFYYEEEIVGKAGIELFENADLAGVNGLKLTETDALGKIVGESVLTPPTPGIAIHLSIDNRLQSALYGYIEELSNKVGFKGGAAVMMDVKTGEIVAMTSYPEYDPEIMSLAEDKNAINGWLNNPQNPFIDRVIDGLYVPGSIVKPFVGLAALEEGVISPERTIVSTGSITIPNPYNPSLPSIFNDWKAHGSVDMRRALAVSSDVYFYEIGGGFQGRPGLGIKKIKEHLELFGFGKPLTGFFQGKVGTIPDPAWKEENFPGDPWRVGDTYFTSIGQYGFQVSPIQAVRATVALANGGTLIEPSIFRIATSTAHVAMEKGIQIPMKQSNLKVIQEGMRDAVIGGGTAAGLNVPYVEVASKTGTAELGVSKARVNSWNIGYFPYDNPRYAYAIIMQEGDRHNTIGALYVMRQLFDWMSVHTPEYFK